MSFDKSVEISKELKVFSRRPNLILGAADGREIVEVAHAIRARRAGLVPAPGRRGPDRIRRGVHQSAGRQQCADHNGRRRCPSAPGQNRYAHDIGDGPGGRRSAACRRGRARRGADPSRLAAELLGGGLRGGSAVGDHRFAAGRRGSGELRDLGVGYRREPFHGRRADFGGDFAPLLGRAGVRRRRRMLGLSHPPHAERLAPPLRPVPGQPAAPVGSGGVRGLSRGGDERERRRLRAELRGVSTQ